MHRHPFDPVSAVLGILAVTFGLLVALDEFGDGGGNAGWWIAVAAVVVGVALLPWRRGRNPVDTIDTPYVVETAGTGGRSVVAVGADDVAAP
jgi:hypothetical protein